MEIVIHPPELDDIRLSRKAEFEAPQAHGALDSRIASSLRGPPVHRVMEVRTFYGEDVLEPDLLDVDERRLPLTEHKML